MTQSTNSTAASSDRFTAITNKGTNSCRIITAAEIAESSAWSVMLFIIGLDQ